MTDLLEGLDILKGLKVIDTDTHALEPPDLWTSRLSPKWGDTIPKPVPDPTTGLLRWRIADRLLTGVATHSAAGWSDWYPARPPTFEDADPGSWDPKERLRRMDEYGIYTQIIYPNQIGFFIFAFLELDPKLRLQCIQAYNDYQAEFCAVDPRRLVPLAYVPFWDIDEAVKELDRCAAMGFKGLNWGWRFERLGFPSFRDAHWDPVLARTQELGMPVNFHIGFNQQTAEESENISVRDRLDTAKHSALLFAGNLEGIAEIIFSGVLDRFPTLDFVSVESGFGYVPFLLEALDWQFSNMGSSRYYPNLLKPSEYFKRQIYATFWFETDLPRLIDLYPDNVMFESDYPHGTSLSPGPASDALPADQTLRQNLKGVPQDIVRKVVQDTAVRVYNLDL